MEIETTRVQVTTKMSKLPPTMGFTSVVKIELHEVKKELIEDVTGTTQVTSIIAPVARLLLKPRSFIPEKLSPLLRRRLNRGVPFCQHLAEEIALCRFARGNDTLYQRPFLMSVNVRVVTEILFTLSSVSVPLDGASVDVFQRLLEEQTVEPVDLDETCSICFENFSESSSEIPQNSIIQMPKCLHSFHRNCIFQWLACHNSCPLCRRVPYEEDQD